MLLFLPLLTLLTLLFVQAADGSATSTQVIYSTIYTTRYGSARTIYSTMSDTTLGTSPTQTGSALSGTALATAPVSPTAMTSSSGTSSAPTHFPLSLSVNNQPPSQSTKGWRNVGIAVGCFAGVAVAGLVFLLWRARRRMARTQEDVERVPRLPPRTGEVVGGATPAAGNGNWGSSWSSRLTVVRGILQAGLKKGAAFARRALKGNGRNAAQMAPAVEKGPGHVPA